MKVVAFIFARGGSKGLPKKNIKDLCGKPLIQYSIDCAKQIVDIDLVVVSTDCDEIATVARNCGAEVIRRPEYLATDSSPEWLSWQHAIMYVKEKYFDVDVFVSLPPTSPLRNTEDVSSAIERLVSTNADICLSVTPSNRNPYFNMIKLEDGFAKLLMEPTTSVSRRQDAPNTYDITTVVYVAKARYVLSHQSIFEGTVVAIEVPKKRAVDIDDIYDFLLAEAIIKANIHDTK